MWSRFVHMYEPLDHDIWTIKPKCGVLFFILDLAVTSNCWFNVCFIYEYIIRCEENKKVLRMWKFTPS